MLPSSGIKLSTEKDSVAIIRSNMNTSNKFVLCPLYNEVVSTLVHNVDDGWFTDYDFERIWKETVVF